MTNHSRSDRFGSQRDRVAAPARIAAPLPGLPQGRRNFMTDAPQADPAKLYAGAGVPDATLDQMEPVAARLVENAHLTDQQPGSMPAGYTFLAQLLAHEVAEMTAGGDSIPTVGPLVRQHGLMLDSIFGPVTGDAPDPKLYRFRASASDPGRPAAVDLKWDGDTALVFDTRNADTPILAQLSALFILFFVNAQSILRDRFTPPEATLLARGLTAGVFHSILRNDLLPRLLHPVVWSHYARPDVVGVDTAGARDGALVPVEFTNAAFRFGHAMVRSTYILNDRSPALPLGDLTRGFPGLEEVRATNSNFWRADWRLFFGDGPQVQMARRIGPNIPPDLEKVTAFLKTSGRFPTASAGKNDIALKDLARGVGTGMQKVATLADALRPHLGTRPGMGNWALWNARAREALVQGWRDADPGAAPAHLLSDPPPYLYVLIEAGADGADQGFGVGRTLGALGSVLTAEVVLPRLRRAEAFVAGQTRLHEARRAVLGRRPLPRTMPQLIKFLTRLT